MTHEERFDRIDASIERIDASIERIDAGIERLSERIDASVARIDATLQGHNERLDRIDANIERLHNIVTSLTTFVLDFRQETAQHFEMSDNRVQILTASVASIDLRFQPVTKAILDFGKVSTQVTNDQFRNKHATTELSARLDRLEEKVSKLIAPAA